MKNKKHTYLNIKSTDKEQIFAQMNSLLSSGLDFANAFELLIQTEERPNVRVLLKKLFAQVVNGLALCDAMFLSSSFTALDVGVIRIGEQTGRLNESLQFLSDYYRAKIAQQRMIRSAVSYPLIILTTAVVVVIFMLLVIVPMFEQVYSRMGSELPLLTEWIIRFSKAFPLWASIFGFLIISVCMLLYRSRDRDDVRRVIASCILRVPIVGQIVRLRTQSHFCKLLYLLIGSGVPLLSAMEMLPSIITLYPYQKSFIAIGKGLCRGDMFCETLTKYPELYGKKLTTLLLVGERTNRLPEMLLREGKALGEELEYRIGQLGSILEPVLILLVGCLVAVVLISMYLPMFKLGGVMG